MRAVVARRRSNGPSDVHVALLKDPHPDVSSAVTFWEQPPPADMTDELLADPATRAQVLPFLDLTSELAEHLAADEDVMVRAALAEHPQLPSAMRDRLCDDPELLVRSAILVREDLSEPSREALYADTTRIFGLGADKVPSLRPRTADRSHG
ncbi:MAG TPA: hypothetical protein VFC19_41195 [Candidatus Limnocylindrales bacterium]|nr:hypothetical protein [Candidatus Limnocylindrales bacterium]